MNLFSCKHASLLVSESMDHQLVLRDRMTRSLHLLMCSHCRRFQAQMHEISEMIRSVGHVESLTESNLSNESRARIRMSLHDQRM